MLEQLYITYLFFLYAASLCAGEGMLLSALKTKERTVSLSAGRAACLLDPALMTGQKGRKNEKEISGIDSGDGDDRLTDRWLRR